MGSSQIIAEYLFFWIHIYNAYVENKKKERELFLKKSEEKNRQREALLKAMDEDPELRDMLMAEAMQAQYDAEIEAEYGDYDGFDYE